MAGFKAGALNFALTKPIPAAEVIATIDSDYLVKSSWLSDLTPHFADPKVALVQAPQDYQDGHEDLFKRCASGNMPAFFYLGMKTRGREERDYPARHHGAHRKSASGRRPVDGRNGALPRTPNWASACSGRASRRLHREELRPRPMPDSFEAYRKQRYRWGLWRDAIPKRHWRDLMPFSRSGLNPASVISSWRWLPWIADGLQLSFVALAIVWTIGMLWRPDIVQPPLTLYLFVTLSMFFSRSEGRSGS